MAMAGNAGSGAIGAMGVDPAARAAAIERKRVRDAARNGGRGPLAKDPTLSQATDSQLQNFLTSIGNVERFAPGDYSAQREQATNAVMDSFNRRMEPRFQKELQDFNQRMAETGNPIGSENYNNQLQQLRQSQEDARLNAQNQAFLTGQGEQQQGFNQGYTGWNANAQLPMQQYSTIAPWAMQNNQQVWQTRQNELDRQNQMRLANIGARAAGGGGGALTYDQRLGLIAAEARANALNQGFNLYNNAPQGNAGNAFAGGLGAGIGAGLGGALR